MPMNPTIRQLEYFLAVARYRSIRKASEMLGISQPTLTSQLAKLEKIMGLSLLERGKSGSLLSPAGKHILPYINKVIDDMSALQDATEIAASGNKASYRLGVAPTLGPYLIAHLFPSIHQRYQELKFFVREDTPAALESDLEKGTYDLIISPLPINQDNFFVEMLLREEIKMVMPNDHPLAQKKYIRPEHLKGEKIITIDESHLFHKQVEELCLRFGSTLLQDYQGNSLDALRAMVMTGVGIAFLPALYIHSEIHKDYNLHVTSIENESMYRLHAIAWRAGSPAKQFFSEFSRELKSLVSERLSEVVEVL